MGFARSPAKAIRIQVHCLRFTGRFVNIQGYFYFYFVCVEDKRLLPSLVVSPLNSQHQEPLAENKIQNKKTPAGAVEAGPLLREAVVRPAPAGWAEASRVGS